MKKHIWKIIFAVVIILMGGSIAYSQYASHKADAGVVIADHVKGDPNAKVKLTEYGDFQCPACGQFYPIVTEVLHKYGDQMAFEFKNFPLLTIHQFALPAAKAAEAAGQQGKFFEMYDLLYTNQDTWSRSATPQAYFEQYAQQLGLNMPLFKQHMRSAAIDAHIKDEYAAAQKLGLTGTPSFFLNGKRLEFNTIPEFTGAIEAALGIGTTSPTSTQATDTTGDSQVQFGLPVSQ